MFGSSKWWGLNSTHIHGTHVTVEEPSTASIADIGELMAPLFRALRSRIQLRRRAQQHPM